MKFECWEEPDKDQLTFAPVENIARMKAQGLIAPGSTFLYAIDADTWTAAMQEHYRRQDWGKYVPFDEEPE